MICPDENNYPNTKVINMLKKSVSYAGSAALVLLLAACASQQPAPVVVGTQSGGSTTSSTADNPYGAAPYNTNTSPAADAPYTPPASTPTPTYNSGSTGTYTPSYAPVDINAATHTVVRGDTVYNISKRYNITQDNLRAWNNLAAFHGLVFINQQALVVAVCAQE